MLLTITTTHQPARDLGFLLHKHPDRVQTFDLSFGQAHVFYAEATDQRCTAGLLLDVEPVGLVRGDRDFALAHYVNDRPYVASSFLSVAIAKVYRSALNGTCSARPDLVQTAIPLQATISVLPVRGGATLLATLFDPLGYTVMTQRHVLDEKFPAWGESPYYTVTLEGTVRLSDLLSHLYVLIPVLDDDKHYYVGNHEVEKLLDKGQGWLADHPAKDLIAQRYLRHQSGLKQMALAQLVTEEPAPDPAQLDREEAAVEQPLRLHDQRLDAVVDVLKTSGATSVVDLGCGEGQLLRRLLAEQQFVRIVGMDVAYRTLERAANRLRLDRMPDAQRQRISLIQGALTYRDARIEGFDAAAVVEVVEHLDPPRLAAFERVVFGCARPGTVVLTTPNAEYNVLWATLPAGQLRHRDHRFEWTRAECAAWAQAVCDRFGYTVRLLPIGPEDVAAGSPSQMAVFERSSP